MSSSSSGYHHGDLAATLERAASQMLDTQSSASLSLRELARRTGVSHNAPYHHFGDRTGLLRAVAVRNLQELLRVMQSAWEAPGTPTERLERAGLAYVTFAVEHPGGFSAIFDPEICDPRNVSPEMAPHIAATDALLASAVREYAPELSAPDAEALGAAIWGVLHGLAVLVAAGHLDNEVVPAALRSLLDARS